MAGFSFRKAGVSSKGWNFMRSRADIKFSVWKDWDSEEG